MEMEDKYLMDLSLDLLEALCKDFIFLSQKEVMHKWYSRSDEAQRLEAEGVCDFPRDKRSPQEDSCLKIEEDENSLFQSFRYYLLGAQWNKSCPIKGTSLESFSNMEPPCATKFPHTHKILWNLVLL
jgi:hypothetical protein